MFITFEGVEGSGKSLQAKLLYEKILKSDKKVLLLRDPGGTAVSEQIREVVLGIKNKNVARKAELLLLLAARAQLVAEKIKPAIMIGKIVICDRFTDSTYAYQVYGRGHDFNLIEEFNNFADQDVHPDITFFLDMPIKGGLQRREKTGVKNRLDLESGTFYERARLGYSKLIEKEPQRWVVIDGRLSVEEIREKIWEVVHKGLNIS